VGNCSFREKIRGGASGFFGDVFYRAAGILLLGDKEAKKADSASNPKMIPKKGVLFNRTPLLFNS